MKIMLALAAAALLVGCTPSNKDAGLPGHVEAAFASKKLEAEQAERELAELEKAKELEAIATGWVDVPEELKTQIDCDQVGERARDMLQRRIDGLTEDQALAELSAAGDYELGFLVDGVFALGAEERPTTTVVDIKQVCRQVNATGSTY